MFCRRLGQGEGYHDEGLVIHTPLARVYFRDSVGVPGVPFMPLLPSTSGEPKCASLYSPCC
jgi:hypothetical protein